jgi:ribosomal protein S12 methylthiotransferase
MGVFSYSDEDTSQSFALDKKVDEKTIARRRDTLMSIQKKISARNLKKRVGQRLQVMLEGPSKDTDLVWEARLQGMAPDIDGKVYITEFEGVNDAADLPTPGTLATIEITEAKDYDLIGRVTDFETPSLPRRIPPQANNLFPILA